MHSDNSLQDAAVRCEGTHRELLMRGGACTSLMRTQVKSYSVMDSWAWNNPNWMKLAQNNVIIDSEGYGLLILGGGRGYVITLQHNTILRFKKKHICMKRYLSGSQFWNQLLVDANQILEQFVDKETAFFFFHIIFASAVLWYSLSTWCKNLYFTWLKCLTSHLLQKRAIFSCLLVHWDLCLHSKEKMSKLQSP